MYVHMQYVRAQCFIICLIEQDLACGQKEKGRGLSVKKKNANTE